MQAFFVGQTYIDMTVVTATMPQGDEKSVADDYAVSFGGNAVTAAFAAAKLGLRPDLLTSLADDWLGRMFLDMAAKYQISVHGRKVKRSSLSFILPSGGRRAILRARDDHYLHPFPHLNLGTCQIAHFDGHQADAALHYAKECRAKSIPTSLDGGGLRSNTDQLLGFIDIAVVAERLCEQMGLPPEQMLAYLKKRGVLIGGVTEGERGMLWYDERGKIARMPALPVPKERIIDTSGAGDIYHGAYVASRLLRPSEAWAEHFRFARAASAYKIQVLGNEAGLPALADIAAIRAAYETLAA